MDVRALGIALPLVALCLLCSRAGAQDGDDFAASALGMEGLGSSPVDLVLLLDTSTFDNTTHSRQQEADVKSFFIRFLADADIDSGNVRVAMVTYSTHPEVLFTLNTYTRTTDVQQAIEAAEFAAGERNTADAISRIRQYVLTPTGGDRPNIPNVILLLQTGQSDRNAFRTAQEAEALRYTGTNIFGIGHQLDGAAQAELEDIVSRPVGENTFLIHQMAELHIVKDIVFLQIFTRADQSYNSPAAASESLDVVFVVHFSSIMKQSEFSDVIRFMKRVVDSAALDNGDVRVAVVLFRKRGVLLYDWNRFFSKHDVIQGLDGIPFSFRSKVASITAGLDTARNELFIDAAGDRRDVPNLVVLVTDSNADADMMQTIPEAERIKATGAAVFTVGVNVTYVDELMGIASSPDYFLLVNSTKYLDGAAYLLYDKFVALRTDEVTEPFPSEQTPPAPPAIFTTMSTTLDVKPARRISTVENREEADIAIAFHISHNVKIRDIKSQFLPFLNDVVASADIDSGAVRISVVSYGTDITTHFDLNTHNKKKKLLKVLRKLKAKPLRAKAGNTLRALQYIANSTFSDVNGDRPGIPNGVILITDKQSGNDLDELTEAAQTIKDAGTPIFVIGVGKADSREVIGIASSPAEQYSYLGKTYTSIAESDELKTMISERFLIFKKLKPKTTTTPTPVASPFTSAVTSTAPTRYLAPISDSEEADIVIALHVSPRATKSDFDSVLDFLRTLVSGADIDNGKVQVGLVFYAADAELIFHMNQYDSVDKMLKEISGMSSDRRSSMVDASAAMALGRQMLSSYFNRRVAVPAALLFITDRSSNQNSNLLASEREGATNEGIEMFSIGIDLDDKQELELLATAPENVMTVSTHTALSGTIDELKRKIFAFRTRSMDDITDITDTSDPQTPAGPMITLGPPTQEEPIVISLTPQTDLFDEMYRDQPFKSSGCRGIHIDIIFLLDTSTSMGRGDFQNMLTFVKNIVSKLDIDGGRVRTGLFTFSSRANLEFSLNSYTTNNETSNAIDNIQQWFGNTNTASALRALWSVGFTVEHGDREGIPNVAVLVTDGVANMQTRQTLPEAHAVKDNDIFLYAFGVKIRDYAEFRRIPTPPHSRTAIVLPHFGALVQYSETFLGVLCEDCPVHAVDIVFIIDGSTSVGRLNFRKILGFVKSVLEFANVHSRDVRVGVLTYSSNARVIFNLNDIHDKAELLRAIDNVPYGYGNTNTADALRTVRRQMFTRAHGDRPDIPNVAVVITDGVSNVNSRRTIPEAKLMKETGIKIIGIGIKLKDSTELDAVVSQPFSENIYNAEEFDELVELKHEIFPIRCKVSAAQAPPSKGLNKSFSHYCGRTALDLVFILDSSTSVKAANFQTILQATINFLDITDIDTGLFRVGLLVYSSDASVQFNLNTHSTKADVINAIGAAKYTYGRTNTAGALHTMRTEMFTPANGDRQGVSNIAIVVTDGVSNINRSQILLETHLARQKGIRIFAIGVGLTNTSELPEIAGSPEDAFNIEHFEDLEAKLDSLYILICPVDLSIRPTLSTCDSSELDIVFLLDSSTSVGTINFETMLNAVKGFVTSIDIDNGNIRVGCLVYNSNALVEFHLKSFTSESDIINALDGIEYTLGGTNTAEALNIMRTRMFNAENGDRSDATNVAVVITDGVSNMQADRVTQEASRASSSGIILIAIGIGVSNENELNAITGSPENVLSLMTFDQLEMKLDELFRSVCDVPSPEPMFGHMNCGDTQMDIVFLLDSSSSVNDGQFQAMLGVISQFLHGAAVDEGFFRVGIVVFGTHTVVQFHLNQYRTQAQIINAMTEITRMHGESNIVDALRVLRKKMFRPRTGDRSAVINTAVIITDGVDDINTVRAKSEAGKVKSRGVRLFVIDVGVANRTGLQQLASEPAVANSLTVKDFKQLHQRLDLLYIALCHDPVLLRSNEKVCARATVDLLIVLDSSTSVTRRNYELMKTFTADLVSHVDVDSGDVRVAVLIYSSHVNVQFHLNAHRTKEQILEAIKQIPYLYGSTNTADALNTVWQQMFVPQNGDRRNADDVVILITDGVSNINSRRTVPEADIVKGKGIHLYAIGIGLSDTRELNAIATAPASDNAFAVREFSDLEVIKEDVFSIFCPESPAVAQECALGTVDLVIILDASTSVFEHNFKKVLSFVKDLLKDASFGPGGVRVGVAIFSTNVQIQFHLDRYSTKADVFRAIDDIPFIYGSTNTADSIIAMRTQMFTTANGDRAGVPNVCIIVTDGVSTVNAHLTIPEAELARAHGIHIYAIGVGLSDRMELDAIASKPASANSFTVQNFDELRGLDRKIFHTICPETTPAPSTTTEAMATTTLPATIPPTVPQSTCGLSKVDVIIILDASTSVTQANFKKMLAFCKDLVDKADVDSGSVRFGALIYSTEVEIQFHLNAYSTSADIKSAIDRIPYIYGSTNSADGLAAMHYQMFTAATGDRAGVDNIAFMITDGVSNINARRTIPEAEDARDAGIHIYAIGIGLSDTRELDAMASLPTVDNSFNVKEFDELAGLAEGIFSSGGRGQCATTTTPLPQTTPAHCGLADVDIVIILDASTSVTVANFKKMLAFVKDLLKDAPIDSGSARVATIIYSTEVEIQFHLNQYISKQQVFEAIDNIPYIYGSTNSADGLATMHNVMFTAANGDRPDVDNIAFMITDGVSNINARRTIPEAEEARADNIHIYAIGIGLTDTRELDAMASTPFSENSFNVQEFDELEGLADRIFGQESTKCAKRKSTTVATTEATTTTTTATTTTISTTTTPVPTTTSAEVEPTTPAPCGLAKTDVVLVLDASTSVTEKNFQKMRQFVKDFLSTADIDSGSDRAGVAIYSTEVQIIFHLDAYTRSSDVMTAIDNIPYIYGSTNTADSIKVMRDDMFTYTRGDRPDAPNVGIIITDGVSNINARRTIPEAESTRDQGIHIYAIGIGLSDTRELDAMASVPAADNSFNVQSFDELKGLEKVIFSAVCPKDPVDGVWAPWDDWSECPASCGTSTQIRVRTCTAPPPSNGGLFCEGEDMEYRECDAGPCPVDGSWSRWQPWSTCSEPCGGGSQSTGRACTDPEPRHGGADCTGRASKSRSCNNQPCGLDGNWAAWGLYGQCSVTCGGGDQARYRTCTDPEPQRGGAPCDGQAEQTQTCNDFHCPIDGMWSTWTDWRQCSRSCGGGSQDRKRYCVNPAPQDGGRDCRGQAGQSRSCNDEPCPTPRTNGYDVIFVLDSSVTPEHFRWMLDYTRSAVREMAIDNGMFRVGLLIYSGGAYKQFDLNDFETRADVNAALDKVGYRPGTKNTAAALKFVRKRMFRGMNGDRDFAQNFVVVLTGAGDSTDRFSAATEACQLQAEGVGMFSVGLGPISDLSELDAYSSLPTHDYEILVRNEDSMGEVPGLMLYNLKRSTPDASACPTLPPTTPRPPRPKGKCSSTGDVVFILDSSGSVGQANFYRLLNFTYETVDGLDVDSGNFRVGVVTFSDSSHTAFHLGDFTKLADLKTALVQVGYVYGNTNTAHALRRARMEMFTASNGDRPDIANVVVIITDGQSNVNHELTITEARSLKAAGVTVITVAVGFTSETSELVGITSPPIRENLIYVEDYESLGKLKEQLIDPLCTDSDLCRSRPCQNGAVCLDGIRSFSCVCPTDYFGDTCNKRCGEPADVVIILDSSTTVGEYNFGRLKEYAEHLVREMNSDACSINIGFLKYSSAAMVQVNLGMHTDTETNIRALEQISYTRGRANMAAAFRTLRTEMFNGRGGDRAEARNIAYLLTDGTNDVHAELTEPEAELTISAGVRVIPIGINLREKYELENIAGAQGLQLIEINDEPALIENTDVILNSLFGNNDFCIENPCLNGGACVNEPFGFVCECKVGFTGDTCQKRCSAKGDVVFAVDTSRYVTRRELKKVRRFLRSIVKRMRFKGAFSVGVVEFSDWSKVRLDFTSGASKKAVKASIAGLRVHGGDPEPAQALAKANYRIFNRRGDSGEKPNYLILVTKSMRNEIDILNEANKLKVQGTRIIGVGMGLTTAERDFMQSTVSMPYSDTAMFADDADDLKALSDRIVDYMCDDDDMCAENPCRNGGKCKQLGGDFYCECNSGYAGRYCENRCNARADIVFLLDSSGSVGHVDFRRVKQFVHGLVDEFTVGRDHTRVGLATYSSKSRHGFFLKEYYNQFELQNAIAGIRYEYGNTNTAAGLRLVRDHYLGGHHGDRADIQNFLIVITDGLSNVVPDQTLVEAGLLKASGVHVYAIGVGAFDPFEINHIASAPVTENAYLLKDYSSLANITSSIVMKTCRDPTVCDENPCTNGGVCIPGINGPVCECLPGFRGEHCDQPCTKHKDIIFLLDSSDSVGADNFKASLTFINSMVEEFSFKDTDNRFSLMTFSDKVQIVFSLGRYRDLRIIQNAIKYTRYRPGNTNIADALRTAVEISVSRLGDRGNAENIVFLLTDGESNINEEDTIPAADDLKAAGARVITIGVNMDRTVEIEQIASSEGDVYKVATYNDLGDVREDLLAKACSNIEDLENTNVVG